MRVLAICFAINEHLMKKYGASHWANYKQQPAGNLNLSKDESREGKNGLQQVFPVYLPQSYQTCIFHSYLLFVFFKNTCGTDKVINKGTHERMDEK